LSKPKKGGLLKENRREQRFILEQQPRGNFKLYAGGRYLDVNAVRDISPFGVMVQVGNAIDQGQEIRLTYQYEEINLNLHGTAMWSKVMEEDGENGKAFRFSQVGIYFRPQDMESNLLFYNTLINQ